MTDPSAPAPALTIACCEDEPALIRLLDECFRAAGHSAQFARTGAEALFDGPDRVHGASGTQREGLAPSGPLGHAAPGRRPIGAPAPAP